MGLSTEEIENIAKATAKQVLDKIEFRFDRKSSRGYSKRKDYQRAE